VRGDCGVDEFDIMWHNVYVVLGMMVLMPLFFLPFYARDYALLQNAVLVAVINMYILV